MNLTRALFANWGVKLLALLLAWGIWFVVREDLDEPRDASLPVLVVVAPGSNIEGELAGTTHVAVKLKGPRRDVDLLAGGTRSLVATIRPDDLAPDLLAGTRAFRASDLELPEPLRPGSVRIVEMEPETVSVRIWRVERRELPIAPPEFPGVEEMSVQVERRRWPQKAVVRAPADRLAQLLVLRTVVDREQLRRFVDAMGDAPRTTVTLPLTIVDNVPGLTVIEPRALEVTADLVRNAEGSVTVPLLVLRDAGGKDRGVRIEDPRRAWFRAGDPPTISLELRGNPRALAAATPQSVRAFVLESELPDGAVEGSLRIHTSDLPSGVVLARDDLVVPVVVKP